MLSMLLTQQGSQASILNYVANAVESLGSCTTEGVFLDGRWQDVRLPGRTATSPPDVIEMTDGGPVAGGSVALPGMPWSWAYSLSSAHGPAGYLVVGAQTPPAESERFLLQVLAQHAGVALANARLHRREREQSEDLHVANLALLRSMEIHNRLTKVACESGQIHEVAGAQKLVMAGGRDRNASLVATKTLGFQLPGRGGVQLARRHPEIVSLRDGIFDGHGFIFIDYRRCHRHFLRCDTLAKRG